MNGHDAEEENGFVVHRTVRRILEIHVLFAPVEVAADHFVVGSGTGGLVFVAIGVTAILILFGIYVSFSEPWQCHPSVGSGIHLHFIAAGEVLHENGLMIATFID